MVASQILEVCLVAREPEVTAQAPGDLLQFHVAPVTLSALVGAGQILVIGVDDEMACPAFRTDQPAGRLEISDPADGRAGEVMDELFVADVRGATPPAPGAKGRQAVA